MPLFNLNYDLIGKKPADYAPLTAKLESLDSVRYQDSAWYVYIDKGSQGVLFDEVRSLMHADDILSVTTLIVRPQTCNLENKAEDWLENHFESLV